MNLAVVAPKTFTANQRNARLANVLHQRRRTEVLARRPANVCLALVEVGTVAVRKAKAPAARIATLVASAMHVTALCSPRSTLNVLLVGKSKVTRAVSVVATPDNGVIQSG